jgi:hypothetical protein
VRKAYEDGVEAPLRSATERIAKARFAKLGTSVYPDATFTLRLNYGTVQGWNENGKPVEPFTRLSRAFERATGSEPFLIPESWQRVKDKLDMNTPFNLSTNNDIRWRKFRQRALPTPRRNRRASSSTANIHSALALVLVRHREESALSPCTPISPASLPTFRSAHGGAHILRSAPQLLASHHLEVDPNFVEHHQRPHRDTERLEPELRLLQRKLSARRERAVLAIERHRHAHVAHLILDLDLHTHV